MTLKEFFELNPKVAIAFSGGVDSAYLLCEAMKYAKQVRAYYAKTQFQPSFEYEDARRLAKELGAELTVVKIDVLASTQVCANPGNRCYYCKRMLFERIANLANSDGFHVLLDGTNASDEVSDRPGMAALEELSVLSPLRICNLTKSEIRVRSKEAGLFTWDKPAYACLATRIPSGVQITEELLRNTEEAEQFLQDLGFRDFRIRSVKSDSSTEQMDAKLQLREKDLELLLAHRDEIVEKLKEMFKAVVLDLEVRG